MAQTAAVVLKVVDKGQIADQVQSEEQRYGY